MSAISKYNIDDLKQMQAWPLERKIQVTQTRIIEFLTKLDGNAYVSFSGGKDSTVLLELARRVKPDIDAVFCDTGLEYPEIRDFVKTKENVIWLKPKKRFDKIIKEYGYPVIGKEVSQRVAAARHNPNCAKAKILMGTFEINGEKYRNSNEKYIYLLDAPFLISDRCCYWMKKSPMNAFMKASGKHPITGMMADESMLRQTMWQRQGCNSFEGKITSMPMAFWTEQDVLTYIKRFNIPYCKIYGDIVPRGVVDGQTKIDGFDFDGEKLMCTGAQRTGCMFCMFGAHLDEHPNRFEQMKLTHPKQYAYCMKPVEDGGLGLDAVLNFINVKH